MCRVSIQNEHQSRSFFLEKISNHTLDRKHDESIDFVYDDDDDDDDDERFSVENDENGDEKESRARSESCDAVVRPVLVPRRRTSLRRTQG